MKFRVITVLLASLLSACSYNESKLGTDGGVATHSGTGSETEVNKATYTWIAENIVQKSCLPCHREGGFMDLTSYDALMASESVVAEDPDNSLFYTEIESGSMPKKKPKLSDEQIQAVKEWILAGALNN